MHERAAVDVLIITAIPMELEALLAVEDGLIEPWAEQGGDPPFHAATFSGQAGPIRVAAGRPVRMGGVDAAIEATRLIDSLGPRCVAMCGVCAGHPDDTDLGDVVIADRAFQHDNGKLDERGFKGDLWTYVMKDRWLRAAQDLEGPAIGCYGYAEPDAEDAGLWWFLGRLLHGRDPMASGFRRYISETQRAGLLTALLDGHRYIEMDGRAQVLTEAGRAAAERRRFVYGGSAKQLPYHVHVGPIGSGNYVVADGGIWKRLADVGMRKSLGVEMEAAAIGAVAHGRELPFVVAKGVMDHGDSKKSDFYKVFAARASAEVLCRFLRQVIEPGGARDSDPGVPFEGRDHGPAKRLRHFMGRDDELADLEQLLLGEQDTVCVVATGIGGIGKTTLVEEFIATRARELFPDGAAWLDGRSLIGELARVSRRFGWADERGPTPVEAIRLLNSTLHGKRVLLVVDNLDPEHGNVEHVPRPGGGCRTLVTSRDRALDVRLDAGRLELGVWTLGACRVYLRECCLRLEKVADAEIDELAVFVGRLPLGVRLLVSVLCNRPSVSVWEILQLLRDKALGVLDKYDKNRGVAATFQVSYDSLDEDGRRVLQALAVCARQTRAEVVEAVAGDGDVREHLDELNMRGLVEFAADAEAPWGLHDVVRMFVLAQPGGEGLEDRHIDWVERYMEEHHEPIAFRAFALGVDEGRRAFERLLGQDIERADSVYRRLEDHLMVTGRYAEATELSESMLHAAPSDSALAANAMNNLGLCYRTLGDLAKAIDFHKRSLAIHERLGRRDGQASNLANLGACHLALDDTLKANDLLERSLAINEKLNILDGQASDLANLGVCYLTLRDIPKAIDFFERSLAIAETLGLLDGQANALANLGLCYLMLGNPPKAIGFLGRSLATAETLGLVENQANALANLGIIAERLARPDRARDYLTRALALYRRMTLPDNLPSVALVTRALARLP